MASARCSAGASRNPFKWLKQAAIAATALGMVLCSATQAFAAATTTTLAVTPASTSSVPLAAGTQVTLTATVLSGATQVTAGTVNFCDGTKCTDIHLAGTAQLTSAGTAVLKIVPGPGAHSYHAVFWGSTGFTTSTGAAASAVFVGPITQAAPKATTSQITATGSTGNYTLTATVSGTSLNGLTGAVQFLDTTNANAMLGSSPLSAAVVAPNLAAAAGFTPIAKTLYALGDFNGDGKQDLVTVDATNTVYVELGNGDGTFTEKATGITLADAPIVPLAGTSIVTGDFNSDGKLDVAILSNVDPTTATYLVFVLLGNGDGTFTQAADFSLTSAAAPQAMAAGDFNNDGMLDLAIIDNINNNVTILLGTGTGTFTLEAAQPASGNGPNNILVGDINNDGKLDLVIPNWETTSGLPGGNTLTVLLGNGDGTFMAPSTITLSTAIQVWSAVLGDFNGDGNLDLAVADLGAPTTVPGQTMILLGTGNGTFAAPTTAGTLLDVPYPDQLAVGDFNGDGKLDLAIQDGSGNATLGASLEIGNADGTFAALPPNQTVAAGYFMLGADFSGDGLTDVAIGDISGKTQALLTGVTQTATASVSAISVVGSGSHDVDASYLGDTYNAPSASATTALTAQQVNPVLVVTASPIGSFYGQLVTLTATLTPHSVGAYTTDGETVTFYNGASSMGTGTLTGGVATLSVSSLDAGSYSFAATYAGNVNFNSSVSSTLPYSVAQASQAITFTAPASPVTYGVAPITLSATPGASTSPVVLSVLSGPGSIAGNTLTITGAGTVVVAANQAADTNYLAAPQVTQSIVVNPAPLSVVVGSASKVYGAANPIFTYTVIGFVNSDTSAVLTGTPSLTTTATAASGVGTYPINGAAGTLAAANYSFTFVPGTLTVNPATLTVTATSLSKTYGAALPTLTSSFSGFVNSDTSSVVTGAASLSTTALATSGVGTYPITITVGSLTAANYTFTFVNGTLTVTPATLTVTAGSASKVYGAALPTLTSSISGFVNGDTSTVVTGTASLTTTATAASGAGSYPITAAVGTLAAPNYSFTFVKGTLTITQATLAVSVVNATKIYGTNNPLFTYNIVGFVNGDTSAVVSGAASLTSTATTASGVGVYPITAAVGTLTAANYSFTFVNGTLTVNPATLTVTASNLSMAYGAALPTLTSSFSGFVNSDTSSAVTGAASLSTTALASSGVGSYPITVTAGSLAAANYTFVFVNGTLTVNPAVLTVTAGNMSKIYGTANPTLTSSISGFVNGDTSSVVTGTASVTTTATATSGAGSYPITAAAGTLAATNYSFTFVPGTLTVTKATLTVTAANANKIYGVANPAFTSSLSGFVNGDTSSAVTGAASLTTTATTASGVGTYPITAAAGTLAAANYTFTFVNSTVTVNPATLTVTAASASRVYGAANPTFTSSFSGFVNGDTSSVVTGAASLTTTATTTSAPGTYPITAAAGSLAAANYAFTFVNGTLTVTLASQTITFTGLPATAVFSSAGPYTLTATGGASGNPVTFSVVSGPATLAGSTLTITGTGTVVVAANQAANADYAAAPQVTQTIVVSNAAQTITFTGLPATATFGAAGPYTLTATGGASGNPVTFKVLSGPGTVAGNILTITGAGTVVVAADQAGNANYGAAPEVTQTIVVSLASQTINFTGLPATAVYGSAGPYTLSATGGGSGNPVTFSVVSGPASLTGSTLTITGAGKVIVAANQAANANYAAATQVTQTIVVSLASQTISFTGLPATATFGSAGPYTLSATGGASGNPVTFTVISGPGSVTGNTLTISGAGSVVVAANQAGNSNYSAAPQVTQTIVVSLASQTITFTGLPAEGTFGSAGPYTLSATGGASGNPVSFSVVSGPGAISGNTLTITGVGTVVVAANQAGNTNYAAATQVTQSIVINLASQAITFTSPASPVTFGAGPITLSATGGASGNPVIFSVVSGPGSIAGRTLSITGAGTVLVAANQAGNSDYSAAVQVTQSIVVAKAAPGMQLASSLNPVLAQNAITLTATVASTAGIPTGTVTFSEGATPLGSGTLSAGGVATLSLSTLTVGSHSIIAAYTGDTNFIASTSPAITQVVEDFSLSITGGGTTTVTVTGGSPGVFNFTLSPMAPATTFPAAVTLSATGLPPGSTATFSPASIAAGAASTPVTLTITTTPLAFNAKPAMPNSAAPVELAQNKAASRLPLLALALLLLPLAGRMRKAGRKLGRILPLLLLLVAGIAAAAGMSGCGGSPSGGGGGGTTHNPVTYTITVTGTSGSLSHSSTVTLIVQ